MRALAFDLVPAERRPLVAARFAELIRADGTRLGTGFLATGMLLPALADNGHASPGLRLLPRPVIRPGSACSSRRDHDVGVVGRHSDGSVRGSLNHYSKGAVASFLYTHLAGIRLPEAPDAEHSGYAYVRVEPLPGPGITRAATRQLTRQGPLEVSWSIDGDTFSVEIVLPATTTADVALPDGTRRLLSGGTHCLTCPVPG